MVFRTSQTIGKSPNATPRSVESSASPTGTNVNDLRVALVSGEDQVEPR